MVCFRPLLAFEPECYPPGMLTSEVMLASLLHPFVVSCPFSSDGSTFEFYPFTEISRFANHKIGFNFLRSKSLARASRLLTVFTGTFITSAAVR